MNMDEAFALVKWAREDGFDAISCAFAFGMAKGYRAAKTEARRG